MFPEEIKIILEKYKEDNVQELQIINKNVSEITEQLKLICAQLSQKMSELMSGVDISTEEDELLQNSKILRKYINSINNINPELFTVVR